MESIKSILLNDDKKVYIRIMWLENEENFFKIKIFELDNSWSGTYTKEQAEKFRSEVDEDILEYSRAVKDCLVENSPTDSYVYNFNKAPEDPDSGSFMWKKKLPSSGMLLLYGFVSVKRDKASYSTGELIDFLINENNVLKQNKEESKNTIDALGKSLEKYEAEIDMLISLKTDLEEDLYGKFSNLLNSKKRRIQLLEDLLQQRPT